MDTPDILNSKIKKIRIELPHYNFNHSSSVDSPHYFIGRERIREKLKKRVEDSPDEPGVYMVAGNRGVGKTSLVSEIIKETSLQYNSNISKNISYIFLTLFFVAGTHLFLQKSKEIAGIFQIILFILSATSFIFLCCFNSYRRKVNEQANKFFKKIHNLITSVFNSIISAFKELSYLINPYNPYGNSQYLLKIILITGFSQIVFTTIKINPIITFLGYSVIVLFFTFIRFFTNKLYKNKQKRLIHGVPSGLSRIPCLY
jgi:AAA+ ATPase superfamily predicted ATPase